MDRNWIRNYLAESLACAQVVGEDDLGRQAIADDAELDRRARELAKVAERLQPGVSAGASLIHAIHVGNWFNVRTTLEQMIYGLEQGEEVDRHLGPAGPNLSADSLHPNVWGAARSYWEAELYSAGIQAAAKAMSAVIQHKAKRPDLEGTDLIDHVLSPDPPKPGQGKLVVRAGQAGKTVNSIRQGVHALGKACYLALRNPTAHETDELDEQVALEQLATLSLFARFVDQAQYVEGF